MRAIDADALIKDIESGIETLTRLGIIVTADWLWRKLNNAIENASTIEPEREEGEEMNAKEEYLLPIWITISGTCPKVMMWTLNEKLQEFFTKEAEDIADTGHVINVEWSTNKHVKLELE